MYENFECQGLLKHRTELLNFMCHCTNKMISVKITLAGDFSQW